MTPQSTFMIVAPIAIAQLSDLRVLLASMNSAPGFADPRNSLVPFYQFSGLHVARFVILEANTNEDLRSYGLEPSYWHPSLAFLGDFDGSVDLFLAELAVRVGAGLRQIFAHCHGFNVERTDLLQWMKAHNVEPTANYVNWQGRTVTQIREEAALANALRNFIKQQTQASRTSDQGPDSPRALRQRLLAFVDGELAARRLRLSPPLPTPPGWWIGNTLHLIGIGLVSVVALPILVLVAPLFFWRLRTLERSDPENLLRPDRAYLQRLTTQEDLDVTNHFTVFGLVKPGIFRASTMRLLLALLNYAARHVYKRGFLTRIQTIHFARWVLIDDARRVFFASNYDGSADSYMDDFINKVAWGLNLVFSNGVGYPTTRWLIKGGAEYEEKYKRTLRRNQLPAESWYKAYPGLTAVDLARNSRIRQGLELKSPSERELEEWLALL